jgi:hypothetical protein
MTKRAESIAFVPTFDALAPKKQRISQWMFRPVFA